MKTEYKNQVDGTYLKISYEVISADDLKNEIISLEGELKTYEESLVASTEAVKARIEELNAILNS